MPFAGEEFSTTFNSKGNVGSGPVVGVGEPPRPLGERVQRAAKDISKAVAQGLTFGFSDEISAYMNEQIGAGGQIPYETRLAAERGRLEEMSNWVRVPGEITGGLASAVVGGGVGLAAKTIVPGVKAGAALAAKLPGWLKAAGLGGVYGGAYGAGTGEGGVEGRARSAEVGALFGAGAGVALYPVLKAIQWGGKKLGDTLRKRFFPKEAAKRKVVEAFERDQINKLKGLARLKGLGPQATLADIGGRNVQGVARAVAGAPGSAANRAEIMLEQRAGGEEARISTRINKNVAAAEFHAAEEAFLNEMRTNAQPIYEQAYQAHQSIMTPGLERLLQSDVGKKALSEAAFIAQTERASGQAKYLGAVDEELTEAARAAAEIGKMATVGRPGVTRGFSLETWDVIKRGFDSLLDSPAFRNELTGKLNKKGFAVDQLRRALIKELDKQTGGAGGLYAKARATYAGDAEVVGALREGTKALSLDPAQITRRLAELSKAGQEAFRTGAAKAMKDIVSKTPDMASGARRLFGNSRLRAQLRAIAKTPEDYTAMSRSLIAEMRFSKTKHHVLGGSQTAPRLAEQADVLSSTGGTAGAVLGSSIPGVHPLVGSAIGRRIGAALFGKSGDEFTTEIGKLLFSRNPAENQRALDEIFRRHGLDQLDSAVKRSIGQGILAAISQQAGKVQGSD